MKLPLCAVYISRTIGDASTLPDNRSGTFHYSQSYANSFWSWPRKCSLHTQGEGGWTCLWLSSDGNVSRPTSFKWTKPRREREREKKKERSLQPEAAILLGAITRAISESDRINLLHLHRRWSLRKLWTMARVFVSIFCSDLANWISLVFLLLFFFLVLILERDKWMSLSILQ